MYTLSTMCVNGGPEFVTDIAVRDVLVKVNDIHNIDLFMI